MSNFPVKNLLAGLVGAVVGGIVGFFIYQWLFNNGYSGPVVPPACVGLGFGLAARKRHIAFGFISAVLAVGATMFTVWKIRLVDGTSFTDFLEWYMDKNTFGWVMVAIGIAMAFSFGMGRENYGTPSQKSDNGTN